MYMVVDKNGVVISHANCDTKKDAVRLGSRIDKKR